MNVSERLAKHAKIALAFSGGKDSLACVYLLREHLDRITVYHVDSGDLLPESAPVIASVQAMAPNFVRIQRDIESWLRANGLPSDLLPYSAHPFGGLIGQRRTRLVSRYDCCFVNLMWPLLERVRDDGNTLLIRGTKAADMPRLPAGDGDVLEGIELYYPVQGWTDADVFAYLASQGVSLPRFYQYMPSAPDCARCSAWWSEKRGPYLKRFHPELYRDYDARLQAVIEEIAVPLANLKREAEVA